MKDEKIYLSITDVCSKMNGERKVKGVRSYPMQSRYDCLNDSTLNMNE